MLYPIIDVGSNTVKLSVLDEEKIFSAAPVFFKAVPMCLSAAVVNGELPDDVTGRLCEQLREYASISSRLTQNPPLAFATAALRSVTNREAVLDRIQNETKIRIEVLSGEQEAYYSFLGAIGNRDNLSGVTVDMGGGSTEILAFKKGEVLNSVSLPMGCITLFNGYFADGRKSIVPCREEIRSRLSQAPALPGSSVLLSGGSAKAILCYKNMLDKRNNMQLSRRQMEKVLWHFDHGSEKEHEKVKNVLRDRFRLVPPAVAVFTEILAHYGKEHALVCRSGVREGRLKAYLMEKNQKK